MHFNLKKYFTYEFLSIFFVLMVGPIFAHASAISTEMASKIRNTHVVHLLNQNEIGVSVVNNNLATAVAVSGGGFIGTLIASVVEASMREDRKKEADDTLQPIKEKLTDFDFRKVFVERLGEELTRGLLAKNYFDIKNVSYTNEEKNSLLKKLHKPGSGSILILETKYYFTEYYEVLVVETNIDFILEPSAAEKEDLFEDNEQGDFIYPMYRGKARFQSKRRPIGDDHFKYWSSGKNVEAVLVESVDILPKLIVRNLLDSVKSIDSIGEDYWTVVDERSVPFVMSAQVLETNNSRDLVYLTLEGRESHISISREDRYVSEDVEEED